MDLVIHCQLCGHYEFWGECFDTDDIKDGDLMPCYKCSQPVAVYWVEGMEPYDKEYGRQQWEKEQQFRRLLGEDEPEYDDEEHVYDEAYDWD